MGDEDLLRLLAYDGRRYWLDNGWSLRFRVRAADTTEGRPVGIKYSFTLHDAAGSRLLGYDNAHGLSRRKEFDHRHPFRRTEALLPYDFIDGDMLVADFFDDVESACAREGVAFESIEEDEDLAEEEEDEDEAA